MRIENGLRIGTASRRDGENFSSLKEYEAKGEVFDAANFVRFARLPLAPSGGEHVSREKKESA